MVNTRRLVRLSSGYGLSVVISGVLSVAVIPAVIIIAGETTWAVIAVAQAVGGFAFVIASAGWGITGPTTVASLSVEERGRFYAGSLVTRTWLFGLVLVPSILVAVPLAGREPAIAALSVATSTIVSLSAGWFYVGESSPIRFLLLETVPRSLGTAVGALALLVTHQAIWFVALQFAGAALSAVISSADIFRRHSGWHVELSPISALRRLRGHSPAMTMAATTSVYVNLPIVIVQVFIPSFTAIYALAERMLRLGLYSTRPLVQVAQGYVPAEQFDHKVIRARRVLHLMGIIAIVGGCVYAMAAPFAGSVLSGWSLHVPFALSIPLGIAVAAMLLSQVSGFACLTAFGSDRTLATSTALGATFGAILFLPLTLTWRLEGLAWALALSELVVLALQLARLRSLFKADPRDVDGPTSLPSTPG